MYVKPHTNRLRSALCVGLYGNIAMIGVSVNPQKVTTPFYHNTGWVIIVYSPIESVLYHGCINPKYQRQGL